jgi:hypothetical protein
LQSSAVIFRADRGLPDRRNAAEKAVLVSLVDLGRHDPWATRQTVDLAAMASVRCDAA